MPTHLAPRNAPHKTVARRKTVSDIETTPSGMPPRPSFAPEEASDARSEWFTLIKAVIVTTLIVTLLALLFVR